MVKVEELCNIEKQSLKSCVVGVGSVLEKKKKKFVKLTITTWANLLWITGRK